MGVRLHVCWGCPGERVLYQQGLDADSIDGPRGAPTAHPPDTDAKHSPGFVLSQSLWKRRHQAGAAAM